MTLGAKRYKKKFEDLPPHLQKISLRVTMIFGLLGWATLIACAVFLWDDAEFMRESVQGTAEVLSVKEDRSRHSDGRTSVTYEPTFRFEDRSGKVHTVTPWYASSEWGFSVGEQIDIRYRPSEPERAVPHGYGLQWLGLSIFVWGGSAFGAIAAFFGTAGLYSLRRRLRKASDVAKYSRSYE
jgi:hypothetical protein